MIRIMIGVFFCIAAFVMLIAPPRSLSGNPDSVLALAGFVIYLAIGITLIAFGRRFLALRRRIVTAAAQSIEARHAIDVSLIAHETDVAESRVRRILRRSGFSLPNSAGHSVAA